MSWWLCGTLWSNSPLNCNWFFCESHVGKTLTKSNVRSWRFRALVLESADTDGPKKRGPVVRSDRQHEELQQSTWIMQKWCWHNLICLYWHIESQLQTSWLILVFGSCEMLILLTWYSYSMNVTQENLIRCFIWIEKVTLSFLLHLIEATVTLREQEQNIQIWVIVFWR